MKSKNNSYFLVVASFSFGRFSFFRAAEEPYDFERRLEELAAHMKGADGLVEPREIRREAVKVLQVRR